MFQIVRSSPRYCPWTDAIMGANYDRLPYAYHSEKLAIKLAVKLSEESYNHCGDDHFYVIKYGDSVFAAYRVNLDFNDEIPF